MTKKAQTYPEKILPTVRSDMQAYFRHGYSFAEYCDRNTYGRKYGKELFSVWKEEESKYRSSCCATQ